MASDPSAPNQHQNESTSSNEDAVPGTGASNANAPSKADELYERGMAHYRRREWPEAKEAFLKLQEIAPERRGIAELLDEIEIFIRLQTMEPNRSQAEREQTPTALAKSSQERARGRDQSEDGGRSRWLWIGLVLLVSFAAILAAAFLLPDITQSNEAESLWNLANAYFNVGNYEKATEVLEELLAMSPTNYDIQASALLERAKRLRDIKRHYDRALEAKAAGEWAKAAVALQAFRENCGSLSTFADSSLRRACQEAPEEIPTLEQRAQLGDLFSEAKEAYANQAWGVAAERFQRLQALDPGYKQEQVRNYLFASYRNHAEELLQVSGNKIDQVELAISLLTRAATLRPDDEQVAEELRLAAIYLGGLEAFNNSEWEAVLNELDPLLTEYPDYAGGRAMDLTCIANLKLGNDAFENGNLETALSYYNLVLNNPECDHTEAELNQIKALSTLYPPTATSTATSTPTATATETATPLPSSTPTQTGTPTRTNTPRPPTDTPIPPTRTPVPPTNTPVPPPTNTPRPTNTPLPAPTNTLPSRER
jgi:tetratricopeptide (TPR) repeat protein